MNAAAKGVACVVLACAPGLAAAAGGLQLDAIARATGLTASEVQMVVGARTPHPEYFTSFERSQRRMIQVLGAQRFHDLMAGHQIVLDDGQRLALVQR
ncbi:MAG: hypothetical protein ACJ8GK_03935 [Luteimonas sp.]